MNLVDYIRQVGDEKAASMWGVAIRTAASWRRQERFPRPEQAAQIVATSPVTYEGIYGPTSIAPEQQRRRSTDKAEQ